MSWHENWYFNNCATPIDHFPYINSRLVNKENWLNMFIHFFCLCPLSLTMKLNFNMSKEVYLGDILSRRAVPRSSTSWTLCDMSHGQNIPRHVPATCQFSMHHTSFFVAPTWPLTLDHLKYREFPECIFIFILNSISHSKIEEKNAFPVSTRCCSVKKKKFEASVFKGYLSLENDKLISWGGCISVL